MKCHLCSPPASMHFLSPEEQWSTNTMNAHHVKEFHLGPYKPLKCSMPNCNASVTVASLFASHTKRKHPATTIEPKNRRSEYLEALTSVMMQFNFYGSGSSPQLASDMTKTIQCGTKLPLTITVSVGALNECQRAIEVTKTENTQDQNVDMTPSTNSASNNIQTLDAGKRHLKTGTATCLFGPTISPFPSASSPKRHGKIHYYCSECTKRIHPSSIAEHVATVHIKKPFGKCDACDYIVREWNFRSLRGHIKNIHGGNATFTDLRINFTERLGELRNKFIRRADGADIYPYRSRLTNRSTIRTKEHYYTAGIKKKEERQYCLKMKYCKKCKISLSEGAVKNHLAGMRHIGKYCLHCNGCEFKAFREHARMMLHIKRKHPGAAAGYSDTTDEIMEELENEENLYIQ